MKNKILLLVGVVVIVIILIGSGALNRGDKSSDAFTVGAILPLTGPAALWGETFQNGMKLALENKTGIEVLYEDSKSTAADGIAAYNLLQNKNVDLTVSELSLVTVPIAKIALEKKTPLLVSLVATENSKIVNDYTTRYYTDPTNYALPAFNDPISPVTKVSKIAILNRNDELGTSVKDKIVELSATNKKNVVIQESFAPNEKDYRTVLTKIKNSDAEVLIFVVANPIEAVGIVKTAKELNIGMPLIESSAVFADLDTRKQVGGISFYSSSYDFSLPGKAEDFKKQYVARFGKEPNFSSAFGYDMINLIDVCKTKKEAVRECLFGVSELSGVAGTAKQVAPGDFVVPMHLEKVN